MCYSHFTTNQKRQITYNKQTNGKNAKLDFSGRIEQKIYTQNVNKTKTSVSGSAEYYSVRFLTRNCTEKCTPNLTEKTAI